MKRFTSFVLLSMLLVLVTSVAAQTGETYYVKARTARVRSEPNTTATVVVTLRSKTAIVVLEVVEGTKVSGSTKWYRIDVNGSTGYIHSSLVTNTPPAASNTNSSGTTGGGQTAPTLQSTPVPLAQPSSGVSCNGATTCSQMASCEQAYACLAAGRSSLDRDKDGIPCESICGG